MFLASVLLAFLLPVAHAAVVHAPNDHPSDPVHRSLPGVWYQEADHPVHSLFRRAPGDGYNYPLVGTPEWSAGFPAAGGAPDPSSLPQPWIAALDAAVAAGKIPDIPLATTTPNTGPVYPQGANPNSPQICSSTFRCRIPGDIWEGPDGILATSFDDGPLPPTPQLVQFLRTNNLRTTFFVIGVNILYYPSQFLEVFDAGHDIAVHTWSHPYMTTISNANVVAQLGWTMQLIHNSTGGRVPRYWRPPYGDSDMRVRSIAKEVFGLETIIWNADSSDWGAPSQQQVVDTIAGYLRGPKSPGLVLLEHTNSAITIGGFMAAFPLIASNGWSFRSVAEVVGGGQTYQNANSSTSDVTSKGVLFNTLTTSTTTATSIATPSLITTSPLATQSPPSASKKSLASSLAVPSFLSWISLVFITFCSNLLIFS